MVTSSWETLLDTYLYFASEGRPGQVPRPLSLLRWPTGREIASLTGSRLPIARADWFAKFALTPKFYYEFLNIPSTLEAQERQLGLSILGNIQRRTVLRAGFSESWVSLHNRVIERHALGGGSYWISYDFRSDEDRSNIFLNPVGPGGAYGFEQAGGEIIFTLPNGLQAYSLIDHRGTRLNAGPTDIVYDPNRIPGIIVAGASCTGCHMSGLIRKSNEIFVEGLSSSLPDSVRSEVRDFYPAQSVLDAALRSDTERVARVLATLDQRVGVPSDRSINPFWCLRIGTTYRWMRPNSQPSSVCLPGIGSRSFGD